MNLYCNLIATNKIKFRVKELLIKIIRLNIYFNKSILLIH